MCAGSARVQTCPRNNPAEEDDVGLSLRPRRPLLRLATRAATAATADPDGQRRAGPDASPAGIIAELERLSRLHESGVLTDQEFAGAKARALGLE
jgi:hypothetical protein